MAEYGRYTRLTFVVRFINDILLSAPSIIIGLFIYQVMVARVGHFSGYAGALALAVIVIPVVVRTTEDMLRLVPDSLREAASALGLPRSHVIGNVAYRAARAGLVTGVLLAVARVSGETAPLLFTALNNQFFSTDLNAPMASLPAVIFQFALSPYRDWQRLAWAGALIITLAVLALSIASARSWRAKDAQMTAIDTNLPQKISVRGLNFFYGEAQALKNVSLPLYAKQGDLVHRAVGLRKIHPAARPEPHV